MKPLALHLMTILLLGSLHTNADKDTAQLVRFGASAKLTTKSTTATTLQPPSLLAPNRRLSLLSTTAVIPTKNIATTTITAAISKSNINRSRQRVESSLLPTLTTTATKSPSKTTTTEPTADSTVSRRGVAHAKIMTSNNDINNRRLQQQHERQQRQHINSVTPTPITTTTTATRKFSSTRLVRDVVDKINADVARSANQAGNVRQNRSLQSGDTTLQQQLHNDNNNNDDDNDDNDVYSRYKYRRLAQRKRFRNNLNEKNNNNNNNADKQRVAEIDQNTKVQHDANKSIERETSFVVRNFTKTPKMPRMIERLVAGHIQNAESRSKYEVSSVTINSTVTNSSTTHKPTALYFRRKQPMLSSSYREVEPRVVSIMTTTTTSRPRDSTNKDNDEDDNSDDEALLEDSGDFDNWDNGILRMSAGSGKETAKQSKKNKEDSKKTLSDQVRDGKYGLIEKELFQRPPKRPGVLSYLANKEVPIDNERTFGGLNEEDIWLAEDHLLVIKGGSLNEGEPSEPWAPIDDYDAPGRQIKIPSNSKVPPPFPVQLEENGPIQFIGNNKFTVVYPVTNETIPVYTAGTENNYTTSENNNEKNIVARPGSSKNATQGEPGYIYPAPYPSWLYHNQTFVNPFLSNPRPITFPGLGPFPLGRQNNTLGKLNGSEPFDEDDPSLYYPPAYSFVYKSNYTNPVAPGPLVPGIVLPPPPNHFSRLEKTDKSTTTSTSTILPTLSSRYRIYPTSSTTSSTTTTTTTAKYTMTSTSSSTSTKKPTTTTTTESPFRHAITKISQYTPKTIIITPAPPVSTTKLSISPPRTPSTNKVSTVTAATPTARPQLIEPVPVPVAVPIPIYPVNSFSPMRSNVVAFVPTTGSPTVVDTLSKSHPIYYEYFEAKRQPSTVNVIDDFLSSTTVKPPPAVPKPIKIYATSKRPFKYSNKNNSGNRNYLQPQSAPNRQYVPENVVYITPKPEVRFKSQPALPPIFKQRPLANFERDVNVIRQTLRYYQNQQLRDNNIPRIPKAKTIYEYNFDASKNIQNVEESSSSFQPPVAFDVEPFKPMVTYSPPVDDENSFRAIAYDKSDNSQRNKQSQQQQSQQEQQVNKYQSSTTLVPVQNERDYADAASQQGRSKQLRLSAKYSERQVPEPYAPQAREQESESEFGGEYQTSQRTILTTQPPWVSLDKTEPYSQVQRQQKQAQQQQQQQMQRHLDRSQIPPPILAFNNPGFAGYYYRPVQQVSTRQNNRFYDEPFTNNVRKNLNYHRPQSVWSLENDTLVNYLPNRPDINPDAEYIDPYIITGYATGPSQRPAPPPLSHQSQYYVPPQRVQPPPLRQPLVEQQQHIPLHRDILVNYRQPLPPINPDSEYISHPHVVRNQGNQIGYRPNPNYGLSPPNANQPSIFYITPKYRRSNNMPLDSKNPNSRNEGNNPTQPDGI